MTTPTEAVTQEDRDNYLTREVFALSKSADKQLLRAGISRGDLYSLPVCQVFRDVIKGAGYKALRQHADALLQRGQGGDAQDVIEGAVASAVETSTLALDGASPEQLTPWESCRDDVKALARDVFDAWRARLEHGEDL